MIDITSKSSDRRAARLSNFTQREFTFDNVACGSIEGILQSLKTASPIDQVAICLLYGLEAKKAGNVEPDWRLTQTLTWQGSIIKRHSLQYFNLITRIYDEVNNQDISFREDLLDVGFEEIRHTIGKNDPNETILTEVEMLYQINRLRIKARE